MNPSWLATAATAYWYGLYMGMLDSHLGVYDSARFAVATSAEAQEGYADAEEGE